ncbi:MAG: hypothetical protein IPG77_05455 [Betaproteobacteria bacterium]|jgi:hypothetical protein|nr:hypothetical protein [Betaproteobacteria bacterium]MBK7276780.1 hypothetical protein [Betaproteobacteria bacterium]MBK9686167.1 hypothetical protein [Betaproteobacteria bacterium]MBL0296171.1 hypothetical protein [Betaproteobacteria bacterium]
MSQLVATSQLAGTKGVDWLGAPRVSEFLTFGAADESVRDDQVIDLQWIFVTGTSFATSNLDNRQNSC